MQLLDGKSLSQQILDNLQSSNFGLQLASPTGGSKPSLHVILVGNDPASLKYVTLKEAKCRQVGIDFTLHHLPQNTPQEELEKLIDYLNNDSSVSGFFIQLPLPAHLNKDKVLVKISPTKDVDGLVPESQFTPAVVMGIIKLLDNYQINFSDKNVVILNDSKLIGQPLKKILETSGALVTLVNDKTPNIPSLTQNADILISATGVKNIVTADMVKDGAIVVDVANGDIDFTGVSSKASFITPTFGGIGPMTIACLLLNTYTAFKNSH